MKTTIYISGKITGIETEAASLFEKAEKELQAQGFETVNPMKLNHDRDKNWASYMKEDIAALRKCDAIYMLSNWTDSAGSVIEHSIALLSKINVSYQTKIATEMDFQANKIKATKDLDDNRENEKLKANIEQMLIDINERQKFLKKSIEEYTFSNCFEEAMKCNIRLDTLGTVKVRLVDALLACYQK